jgi:hypothetical protein
MHSSIPQHFRAKKDNTLLSSQRPCCKGLVGVVKLAFLNPDTHTDSVSILQHLPSSMDITLLSQLQNLFLKSPHSQTVNIAIVAIPERPGCSPVLPLLPDTGLVAKAHSTLQLTVLPIIKLLPPLT